MPRILSSEACLTCRRRKLKCDESVPICNRCRTAGRYCDRSHIPQSRTSESSSSSKTSSKSVPDPQQTPRDALQQPLVARLFHHYIAGLAPWYDLSDADRTFGRLVPRLALTGRLLFNATLAFAAIHLASASNVSMKPIAESYHSACVALLLALDDNAIQADVTLAAVCLLRSYEILAEDSDPNRHLSGAYALASSRPQHTLEPSLHRAAFFNFLREDITFALMNRCTLKIDAAKLEHGYEPTRDEDQLNVVTLVLGQAINASFSETSKLDLRTKATHRLADLHRRLPSHFKPIHDPPLAESVTTLPNIYMLHDSHVATMQYYIVAKCVLDFASSCKPDLEHLAIRLCGLAFTADSDPVLINSFGPISFCGAFIANPALRDELVRRLTSHRKSTGWPIQRLVDLLWERWQELDEKRSNG